MAQEQAVQNQEVTKVNGVNAKANGIAEGSKPTPVDPGQRAFTAQQDAFDKLYIDYCVVATRSKTLTKFDFISKWLEAGRKQAASRISTMQALGYKELTERGVDPAAAAKQMGIKSELQHGFDR